jgi:hypothetical protein
VGGYRVDKVIDYIDGYEDIPASNVLRFFLENGSWFAVRPSGTEPKIKFYFYSCGSSRQEALDVNAANSHMDDTNLDVLGQRGYQRTSEPVGRSQSRIRTTQGCRSLTPFTHLATLVGEVNGGHK